MVPICRLRLGAGVTLLADDSGDVPFDEANSKLWWELAAKFPGFPIPPACLSATVELRGLADTEPGMTEHGCRKISISFLQRRGLIDGDAVPLAIAYGRGDPSAGG